MAVAGSLTYDTKIDKDGFNKGLKEIENSTKNSGTKIKDIVTALGIDKIVSTTMNTLKSSISSAMGRIDTMDQFTRVMTVMTGSTEKADEALESIKNTVTGTAYGLDIASKSTQKFVTSGMKIDKSTKQIQTWADAVAFYGDGTNATFEGVTDALSKMVAKGKVEMDQLNRLTDAGIPAVQIYADSVGKSVTEVQDDLSKGKISTEQFLDGLDNAFNNGTNKFASITGAAKEAGSSWTATFDNFKAAITRGMTKVIDAIDEGLKSVGLKTMREMIAQVGKQAEKVMNKIAPLIKNGIKKLKDVYDWIKRNKDMVKNLIIVMGSLTAGYIAYQKVLVAIKAIQTVKNIVSTASAFLSLIPSIKSAKDAMMLLNMTFSANPVGLVVAGVVALTGALVAFSLKQSDAQKEAKKFAEEMENSRKAFEEYNENIDKNTKAELAQINTVERLKDELKQLVDENGKVKEGYEGRVDFILNQLNEALGTEYKRTGELIDKYKDLQKEIDNLIMKKKAQIKIEASEEKYKNAIKEEENAINDLKIATEKLEKAKEEYSMTLDELREKAQNSIGKEKEEIEDVLKGYDEAVKRVKDNTEIQKQYTNDYALYIQGKYDEVGKSIIGSTSDWTGGTLSTLVEGIKNQSKELEEWKSVYEVAGTELSKTQKENAEKNLTELAQNLHDRTRTVGELGRDEYVAWKALAEENYRVYSEQLGKMDPTLRQKIENLTGYLQGDTSLPEGMEMLVKKTTSTYEEKMKFLLSSTDNKLTDIEAELRNNTGIQNEAGMIVMRAGNEIEKDTTVSRASKILADNANRQFNDNVDGKKWGTDLSENISTGMTSKKSEQKIKESSKSVAGWIRAFLGHSVPETGPLKDELTYMPDMINNLVKGIEENKYKVVNTTSQLAKDIKNSFELEELNKEIISKMQNAVSLETGSINAKASVKANNSMLNVLQATFNVDGSVNIDGQRAGRILTPYMTKTLRTGGAY